MTVYVDDVRLPFGRMIMCHMWADSFDELLAMADRIGVQRKWLQQPPKASWVHFDISLGKKALALAAGAVLTDRYGPLEHVARLHGDPVRVEAIAGRRAAETERYSMIETTYLRLFYPFKLAAPGAPDTSRGPQQAAGGAGGPQSTAAPAGAEQAASGAAVGGPTIQGVGTVTPPSDAAAAALAQREAEAAAARGEFVQGERPTDGEPDAATGAGFGEAGGGQPAGAAQASANAERAPAQNGGLPGSQNPERGAE